MIERWEIVRLFLRWQVNLVSEFPNGVAGVRVRPFRHQPTEMWSMDGSLLSVHCETCKQSWRCATRRALDALCIGRTDDPGQTTGWDQ